MLSLDLLVFYFSILNQVFLEQEGSTFVFLLEEVEVLQDFDLTVPIREQVVQPVDFILEVLSLQLEVDRLGSGVLLD